MTEGFAAVDDGVDADDLQETPLYWAAPNVKGRSFKWVTPGSVLALLIWMIASAGFAFYVANFAFYDKAYGTLAGVIIFLVWWISNIAILLGPECDLELARQRAAAGGLPEDEEPYVPRRDTRKWSEGDRHRLERSSYHTLPRYVLLRWGTRSS